MDDLNGIILHQPFGYIACAVRRVVVNHDQLQVDVGFCGQDFEDFLGQKHDIFAFVVGWRDQRDLYGRTSMGWIILVELDKIGKIAPEAFVSNHALQSLGKTERDAAQEGNEGVVPESRSQGPTSF